ncbi:hypothetical protein [Mucisphaera sp.]|uniref:hypothetical protein n=1 Tax=Mucisphaera sp. TaxID=2913024 RepID=UPI003D0F5E91
MEVFTKRSGVSARLAAWLGMGLVLSQAGWAAGQVTATWTGGGGNDNWSDPLNWDIGVVPVNTGGTTYDVVLPGGVSVDVDAGTPAAFTVNSITGPLSVNLDVEAGRVLTVLDDAGYQATTSLFSSSQLVFSGTSGSLQTGPVTLNGGSTFGSVAPTYDLVDTGTSTVLNVSSSGSVADLSSATTLLFGNTAASASQFLTANLGLIDLSSVTTLTANDVNDSLTIRTISAGSEIRLGSLTTLADRVDLSSAGAGPGVDVSGLTTLGGASDVSFTASSSGLLDVSGLTTLGSGTDIDLTASSGGILDLSSLTTFGSVNDLAIASNTGSTLDLSGVTTFTSGDDVSFTVSGGVLDVSGLTSLGSATDVTFTVNNGGSIDVSGLAAIEDVAISLSSSGSTLVTGGSLVSLDRSTLSVASGAIFAPAITSYSGQETGSATLLSASTNGSVLDLSGVTTFSYGNAGTNTTQFVTSTGGLIDLSGVTAFAPVDSGDTLNVRVLSAGGEIRLGSVTVLPDRMSLTASGAGALLDLSGVTTFGSSEGLTLATSSNGLLDLSSLTTFGSGQRTSITVSSGGVMDFSSLSSLGSGDILRVTVNVNALLDLSGVTTFTSGDDIQLRANGGVIDLSGVTDVSAATDLDLTINSGGSIDLSGVTSIEHASISLSGAGSMLVAPGLVSLDGSLLSVASGATFMPGVTSYSGVGTGGSATLFNASTNGSVLDLSSLTSFSYGNATTDSAQFITSVGGLIDLSNLASVSPSDGGDQLNIRVLSGGGEIRLGSLAALPSNLTVSSSGLGAMVDLSGLTTFGSLDNLTMTASSQGVIDLSGLTTFGGATDVSLTAGSNGGSYDFSSLTSLGTGDDLTLRANSGGVIDMSGVTSFTTGDNVLLTAAGGSIDLSGLTSLSTATDVDITVSSGGTLDVSSLTAIEDVDILISTAGSSLVTSASLVSLDRSLLTVNSDAVFAPGITSYSGEELGTQTIFSVSGGTLDLSSLTSLAYGNSGTDTTTFITSQNDGVIDLSSLTTLTAVDSGDTLNVRALTGGAEVLMGSVSLLPDRVTVSTAGVGAMIDLSGMTTFGTSERLSFSATTESLLDLSSVTTLGSGAMTDITVASQGAVDLGSLVSLGSGDDLTLRANDGGTLDLSTVTAFSSGDGVSVTAVGSGVVDLSGVGDLSTATDLSISLSTGGTVDLSSAVAIEDATVSLSGVGTQLVTGAGLASLDRTTFTVQAGATYAADVALLDYRGLGSVFYMNVSSAGSALDFSEVTELRYGNEAFGTSPQIRANDGALIDLSGLTTLVSTEQASSLTLGAINTNATLLLGSLGSVNERTTLNATGAGTLLDARSVVIDGSEAFVNVIVSTGATMRLGSILRTSTQDVDITGGGELELGGDFINVDPTVNDVDLAGGTVAFRRGAEAFLEVGGVDSGLTVTPSGNDNFGIGVLELGGDGQAATVYLLDAYLQGGRSAPGVNEALYLYGVSGSDGLSLLDGSELVLDGINVYANVSGVLTHLNALFGPTDTVIAFGGGTLRLERSAGLLGDLDLDGDVDGDDITLILGAVASGSGQAAFDLDGDLDVDAADSDELVLTILDSFYGDANLDGAVDLIDLSTLATNFGEFGKWSSGDFNGDYTVDLIDLSILATNFGSTSAVPEPAGAALVGLGALVVGRRRSARCLG